MVNGEWTKYEQFEFIDLYSQFTIDHSHNAIIHLNTTIYCKPSINTNIHTRYKF